jgi:Mrp family chromosome partitioning ATPase
MIEEYKALRANITFSIPSGGCKIIGITSAEAYEGKSISCLNLGIAFAETKVRVLVIDCDLRMPKLARLISQNAIPGISNVLVNLNTIDEVVQHIEGYGLDVVLSGDIPPIRRTAGFRHHARGSGGACKTIRLHLYRYPARQRGIDASCCPSS